MRYAAERQRDICHITVLDLAGQGFGDDEIAQRLGLDEEDVRGVLEADAREYPDEPLRSFR